VIYARDGVELSRALLADWVGACCDLLAPLVPATRKQVTASEVKLVESIERLAGC
jgi:transposase